MNARSRPSASGDATAPLATARRRLMKEYQSIQAEMEARSPATDPDAVARPNVASAVRGSAASSWHPDVIELRPYDVDGEDLFEWQALIRGTKGGFYQGGVFAISILVPPNYPTKPPKCWFKTRIWHPNVSWKDGEICLDVLSSGWSPAWTLSSCLTAILSLLEDPEPDSPLNVDAANVWRSTDRVAYRSACQMYTRLHAVRPDEVHGTG